MVPRKNFTILEKTPLRIAIQVPGKRQNRIGNVLILSMLLFPIIMAILFYLFMEILNKDAGWFKYFGFIAFSPCILCWFLVQANSSTRTITIEGKMEGNFWAASRVTISINKGFRKPRVELELPSSLVTKVDVERKGRIFIGKRWRDRYELDMYFRGAQEGFVRDPFLERGYYPFTATLDSKTRLNELKSLLVQYLNL